MARDKKGPTDDQITLIDEQGHKKAYDILFTFHSDDYDKSYVLLYPVANRHEKEIEVQAFSYDDNAAGEVTSSDLHEIKSDAEWQMVQGVLNTFLHDDRLNSN